MNIQNCIFCNLDKELIIEEKNSFFIVADPYPLVKGHTMIVSKKHYGCCAELEADEFEELESIKNLIESRYSRLYGSFLTYEHGRAGTCCSINNYYDCHHMHLHILPMDIKFNLSIDICLRGIEFFSFKELRDLYNSYGDYLLIKDSKPYYIFYPASNKSMPSHYLRTIIAIKLGQSEKANWQKLGEYNNHKLDTESIQNDLS